MDLFNGGDLVDGLNLHRRAPASGILTLKKTQTQSNQDDSKASTLTGKASNLEEAGLFQDQGIFNPVQTTLVFPGGYQVSGFENL